MARYKNNPFPGVDASQYANWPKVTLPNGEVYYVVPGHPGYVYDATASAATGRTVFRANPQGQIEEQQKQKDAQEKAQKQAEFNQSPGGQIIPVVAGTAGTIAAAYGINSIGKTAPSIVKDLGNGTALMSDNTVKLIPTAPTNIPGVSGVPSAALPATQAEAVAQGVQGAPATPTGLSGQMVSVDPAVPTMPIQEGLTIGNVLSAAAVAKGGYDVAQGFDNGGEGVRGGLTTAGAGAGSLVAGPVGAVIGGVGGNILGYGLQGSGFKNNLALAPFTGGLSLIPGVGDGIRGLMHKTVAQEQNSRLKNVEDIVGAPKDLGQFGLSKEELIARETANGGNAKFAETRLESDLRPEDTMEGLQNYELVGNDYKGKWNDAQRRRFNELNLQAGNIRERKGGLYFNDQDQALAFKEQVDKEAGFDVGPAKTEIKLAPPKTQAEATAQAATTPVAIQRPTFTKR